MIRRNLAAAAFLFLPSCALFTQPDTTPLVEASAAMMETIRAQASITSKLVNHPGNGMSPEHRDAYNNASAANVARAQTLHDALVSFANDLGEVDWREFIEAGKKIADQVRLDG